MDIKAIDSFITKKLKQGRSGRKSFLWLVSCIILYCLSGSSFVFIFVANTILVNYPSIPNSAILLQIFTPLNAFILFGVLALAGTVCLILTIKAKIHEGKLKKVATIIETYRRISLRDLSEKSGIKQSQIFDLITTICELEILAGHFDRETDEFITEKAIQDQMAIHTCPNCGANLDKSYLVGEKSSANIVVAIFNITY